MGHRNSSSHSHDAHSLCSDGSGAAWAAAGTPPLKMASPDLAPRVSARIKMRTADSSQRDRAVRKTSDRKANSPVTELGMTPSLIRGGKEAPRQVAALEVASSKRIWASWAAAWLLLAGIRFYQAVFAPAMPVGCKFYPSCSHYAAEAIARHGAARGVWLAAARLWRCRPFTKGGFDPVPDADANMSELFGRGMRNAAGYRASNEVGS